MHDPERGPLVRQAFEDLATGRYTKQEVIARATGAGLRSRKGLGLSPQSFGQMMRNPIYAGKVESPDYGVSVQGDFEPLVDEATFYRAQAVLDGRVVVAGPRQRNHPDFPLRGFVRCDICGRPLTGSWSKGRNGHYAYYHCQRQCRAVNVSKAVLEGAFVDELALLQPTPGYMRLVKDRILHVWEQRRSEANDRTVAQQRRVSAIQQKMDKLDEAFLYSEAIDVTTYGRQRDKLREELTLAKIDHHAEAVDELDVEGILAFAERILPRASDLWVQASLDYKQRLQQLFFPEGIAFDGNRFNRTAATAPLFKYLAPSESADEKMVSREGIEPSTCRLRVDGAVSTRCRPRHFGRRTGNHSARSRGIRPSPSSWGSIGGQQRVVGTGRGHPGSLSPRDRQQPDISLSAMLSAVPRPRRRITSLAAVTLALGVLALAAPLGESEYPASRSVRCLPSPHHRGAALAPAIDDRSPPGSDGQRDHQHGDRALPDQRAAAGGSGAAARDRGLVWLRRRPLRDRPPAQR